MFNTVRHELILKVRYFAEQVIYIDSLSTLFTKKHMRSLRFVLTANPPAAVNRKYFIQFTPERTVEDACVSSGSTGLPVDSGKIII